MNSNYSPAVSPCAVTYRTLSVGLSIAYREVGAATSPKLELETVENLYLHGAKIPELHRLEAGHFAVEDCLAYISDHIHRFFNEKVAAE